MKIYTDQTGVNVSKYMRRIGMNTEGKKNLNNQRVNIATLPQYHN